MNPLFNKDKYSVAILTMSDSGSKDNKIDECESAIYDVVLDYDWKIVHTSIMPDNYLKIQDELLLCTDKMHVTLVLTTGGTGISFRDLTPEATTAVLHRELRGIPEIMRTEIAKVSTSEAIVARGVAGIRNNTLVINLPDEAESIRIGLRAVMSSLKNVVEELIVSK
ncbi:MAG: molybdopterin-binding protein [Bacillota bacterium]